MPHHSGTDRPDVEKGSAPPESWSRAVIVSVKPSVDGGRWPIQRSIGEEVEVEAGVVIDGHDRLAVELRYRREDDDSITTLPMKLRYNDEYVASFEVEKLGKYEYQVAAWVDLFATWQDQFKRRVEGGVDQSELDTEMVDGLAVLKDAHRAARGTDKKLLKQTIARAEDGDVDAVLDETLPILVRRHSQRHGQVESEWLKARVDPELARFAAWYEFFPRSAAEQPGKHGTLDDAADRLERIKNLGFDVVYLPPIHPIGTTFRKGKDNNPKAERGEPGSPWAIGSEDGGHKSVAPELGGMEAFDRFVARAEELGLAVALDIAFQTSPDHPYVREHPEWFRHRSDGTIRYAENPPKKYQDVYPFDFESEDWRALWDELKSVFDFWIGKGVKVFRVDNPHTKPFAFWEWCVEELRRDHPDVILLAEAFARPKTMYRLAKLGYNNSYTYFAWRNTKEEIEEYCRELFQTEVGDYYRPSFWPNTPDILTDYLARGGRSAHIIRLILAATLSPVYGLYGPPYEHLVHRQHDVREEYADNEKYEVRHWNWNDPHSLQPLMRRINQIRRQNPALQFFRNIRFHYTDNPHLIAYSKRRGENHVLCVINLDPYHPQAGWVSLDLEYLGIEDDVTFEVHDQFGGERFRWHGRSNYVELHPHSLPAHVLRIHTQKRTEQDFEYFG